MEDIRRLVLKVFGVKQVFFQCLHGRSTSENVHPGQGPILGFLLHHGGSSQADIGRHMGVSAATVAVSVSRLEKLGFVSRERNQQNQRANILCLTEEGRRAALEMEKTMQDMGRAALEGFTAEDCRNMEAYCDRMIHNLQSHCKTKE